MHKIIFLLTLSTFLFSQQAEVTNIQAAQRTDGSQIVDITYDLLEDDIFEIFVVTIDISLNGGDSYQVMSSVEGDIGPNVTAGMGKILIWSFGEQFNETYSDQIKIRINASSTAIIVQGPVELPFDVITIPSEDDYYWCSGGYSQGNCGGWQLASNSSGSSWDGLPINIDYDYEIMKYEVTDYDYVIYLMSVLADQDGNLNQNYSEYPYGLFFTPSEIYGYYPGDAVYPAGSYPVITPAFGNTKISFNDGIFQVEEGFVNHPVTGVTWIGAWLFANYYGMTLPTRQEWKKASRGMEQIFFPWGEELPNSGNANYWNSGDPFDNNTTPVGSYNGGIIEPIVYGDPNIIFTECDNGDGFINCDGDCVSSGDAMDLDDGECQEVFDCEEFYWDNGACIPDAIQTNDSPSPYDLYDMGGNVSEYILSGYSNSQIMGGDFTSMVDDCGGAEGCLAIFSNQLNIILGPVGGLSKDSGDVSVGFRCVRRIND